MTEAGRGRPKVRRPVEEVVREMVSPTQPVVGTTAIAEEVDVTRQGIKPHLDEAHEDGKIAYTELGRSKLWFPATRVNGELHHELIHAQQTDRTRGAAKPTSELLNLGCGQDYREGWWNVDIRESLTHDERVDLSVYPWPWPDNTYEHVLASHVIEHLPNQHRALHELARITQPGGHIRIRAPHWNSASMAIDPTHTTPLDPRTLTHELAPDWTIQETTYHGVRGAQLLPDSVAVWIADMIGHFVIEWTADLRVEVEQ